MTMRRVLLTLGLVAVLARFAVPDSPQPVEITFCYTSDSAMNPNLALFREFEAQHPGIVIKPRLLPADVDVMHDRFVTALSAGECDMDCFAVDLIWVAEFANAGWLHPLDEYATRGKLDTFIPSLMPSLRWKGRLYALPWACSVGTLFYRKDLLSRAGLRPPQTWDELIDASHRLKAMFPSEMDEPFVYQGARYEGLVCDFVEHLWANGTDVFDGEGNITVNSDRAVEALQFYRDLSVKHHIAPAAVTAYKEQDGYLVFTQGRAPFLRSWPYVMLAQNAEDCKIKGLIGLTRVPGRDGPGNGCLGTWCMGVSALSPHPREAYLLMDFLTQKHAQKIYATKSGLCPSLAELYTDPETAKEVPYLSEFLDIIATAKSAPISPLYPKVTSILQIQAHRALTGEMSPRAALDEAAWKLEMLRQRYAGIPLQ